MSFTNLVVAVFWNKREQRLRALWRLGLHGLIVLLLISVFTFVFLLLVAALDLKLGINFQTTIATGNPNQILQIPWVGSVLIPFATLLGILLGTLFVGRWIDRRDLRGFGLTLSRGWWQDFGFGLGLGAFLMGLIFVVGTATDNLSVSGYRQSFSQEGSFLSGFLQAFLFFVFVGVYEELLSRGYHLKNLAEGLNFKFLGKRWAVVLALIISSLMFGFLHRNNPNSSMGSFVNLVFAGIFLGLGRILTGRLGLSIGLHISWNFFQGNVFGFPVSGIKTGATLIATQAQGPEWLTGGEFGPEAGVFGLCAILLGCIMIILWARRRGQVVIKTELADYQPLPSRKTQNQS